MEIYRKSLVKIFSFILFFIFWLSFAVNGFIEQEHLLLYAKILLSGKKLYLDLFSVQPPLIFWLYTIPVFIGSHMGIEPYQALVFLGCITVLGVIYISLRLIKLNPVFALDKSKQMNFCLLLFAVFVLLTNPMYFADRDHLFLILTFPYILRFMPSIGAAPIVLRIIIGLLAAIGFCIKPHCFVVFAFIQLAVIWRQRSLRALFYQENIVIYLFALVYLGCIFVFTPQYINTVLPMASATYDAANARIANILLFSCLLFQFLVIFVEFRLRYKSPYRQDIFYLSFVSIGLLIYALANNGWSYSWNPLNSVLLIIAGLVFWEFVYLNEQSKFLGEPTKKFIFGMRSCILVFAINIAFAVMCGFIFLGSCGSDFQCKNGKELLKEIDIAMEGKKLESFGTVSISFYFWPQLVNATGAKWDTRFNHLWMLPKFLISSPEFTEKNKWILEYISNGFAEDMAKNKPQLMFVDDTNDFYAYQGYVDLVAYFSKYGNFAKEWQHYKFARKIEYCEEPQDAQHPKKPEHCGYFIYKRVD